MSGISEKITRLSARVKGSPPLVYLVHLGIFLLIMIITKYFFEFFFEKYPVFHFNSLVALLLNVESHALNTLLNVFGFDFFRKVTTFTFSNACAMDVQAGCSGFKQLFQVFFVFLLIPGRWTRKIWYIPIVLAVMFCATILHLFILSVVMANWPDYFQLTHVWASRAIFYSIMFLTWLIWEEKVGFAVNRRKEI